MGVARSEEGCGGRTVVVGVKLDSQSRELLTWALVKVARPGDTVVALHVHCSNENLDCDRKLSLLSLVKSFDSILTVYEGFCNLKQIDLKLKIRRGSSIQKTLVSEAKSYSATQVVLGTSENIHRIGSMAKFCAKKLPKECSLLALNKGKIIFHRKSNSASDFIPKETEYLCRNGLLNTLQRSFNKNSNINGDGCLVRPMLSWDRDLYDQSDTVMKQCSICSMISDQDPGSQSEKDPSGDGNSDNLMAIIPAPKLDESTELKPGWPLLQPANLQYGSHMPQKSVVKWAMQLPSRYCSSFDDSTRSFYDFNSEKDSPFGLDDENGVIVSLEKSPVSKELKGFHDKYSATCRLFKFDELVSITSNFSPENMIGKGGSSQVYRGCLPDGKEVAVKTLKPSEEALKEFTLEIEMITTLNHKSIVSLVGFCFEGNHLLLVYDFLSNGSLEENLHGAKKGLFGWGERYKVAIGVAEALDYLHTQEPQIVIHRDVKSSNILLSDEFEPRLSDFGLATWGSSNSSHITCSDIAGTFGYLAPEYFVYGKVNEKVDVYAFGVVLLELLSGRKPIDNNCPKGEESLVLWAKPILNSGKFSYLLDPNLGDGYDRDEAERMVLAASLCIRRTPRARPQMSFVLKLLQGDIEALQWAKLQVIDVKVEANAAEGSDSLEDETFFETNLWSHLNLALLGVEEGSFSVSSIDQSVTLEEYLRGRWSRSSSFD